MCYGFCMTTTATSYIPTTERAKAIRAALKATLKASARQVSVRVHSYSMGATIYVTVKDPTLRLPAVEAIAGRLESVARDHATGEILNGGNTYVMVDYDYDAYAPLWNAIKAQIAAGAADDVFGWAIRYCCDIHTWRCDALDISAHSSDGLARRMAIAILSGGDEAREVARDAWIQRTAA